ncbi:MAG: caspase family protein, partial [bacterium]|nr:caspase family protein [bacterium]
MGKTIKIIFILLFVILAGMLNAKTGGLHAKIVNKQIIKSFVGSRGGFSKEPLAAGGINEDKVELRRFALVIGANYGGRGRVRLRYAVTDAKSIIDVLETMGGVSPDDSRLLVEPSRDTLFWELGRLRGRIKRAKAKYRRVEVIFYYSGHSDAKHFLLGKERVPYKDFKDEIETMDADVRIAVLDSCASG